MDINPFGMSAQTPTGPTRNVDLTGILTALQNQTIALNGLVTALQNGLSASLYPTGATPINVTSGNGAASIITATLPGATGQTTYLTGFDVSSSGASVASIVVLVITDTSVGVSPILLGYNYGVVAGVTMVNANLSIRYSNPVPAASQGANITLTLPSLGTGNTNAIINAYGFRL